MFNKAYSLLALAALIPLAACMTPPSGLELALDRPTTHHTYAVAVHPMLDPVPINRIHAWEIKVTTAAGKPVSNAKIDVSGGMPQHGHGFPTQPRVTRDFGDGRYLLEGMKFSMSGWWEIKLAIQSANGDDSVTFNKIVEQPASFGGLDTHVTTASLESGRQ